MSPTVENGSVLPDLSANESPASASPDPQNRQAIGSVADSVFNSLPLFTHPLFLMVNSLETGGTERQFVQMARSLSSNRVNVHLGCLLTKGPFAQELPGLKHFDLGGSLYGIQSMRARLGLRRHLSKLHVKVAHAFDFYTNLTLIPAAKLAGVRVIGSHRQLGDLLTPAQFRAQQAAFHLCDRVVCNSRAAADKLFAAGLPEHKIVVIGNALPDAAFADPPAALPTLRGKLRIGMIARMNAEYKNHRLFLRAARSAVEKVPNLEFALVGDGPLRSALEQEAEKLGLLDRIHFLGDRRDIAAVLRSLDLSIIPSSSESLSNVMLESMAARVPVIATAVGGNVELGSEGRAVLVPANNEQALADAIIRMSADEALRAENVSRACDHVRHHFSAQEICRQYIELYANTLSESEHLTTPIRSAGKRQLSALRVAIVAPSLRYVGGQAVQADLLLRHWNGDPDIAASFVPVDPKFSFGLRWAEKVPVLRTLVRQPFYFFNLWNHLKDADIVHIFSASYTSFLLAPLPAWFVAQKLGKKTIINYRSGEARSHLQRSQIARHVLQKAGRLVVPSGYLVEVFREFGLAAEVVPNIIDLSQFQFRKRAPLRPHLVCTRGFHPYYGIDVVARAFAEVQKQYPQARLDLVGGGPLLSDIRNLVRKLNLSNVNFLGIASRKEIGRLYDGADIFVNASNLDNMPVSVLEAFASGTPVVTTEPAGMKYIVTHEQTGLLSPVADSGALAQNVLRILRDPELAARLSQNALEESARYQWTSVRGQWLRIYSDLAAAKKSSNSPMTTPACNPEPHGSPLSEK